ncbi:hypothetical protein [Neorhizobium galegae]|uniref:hypothetical protein n=1 Tax=Neorhizobium galegae TaxID=399 RepID=UPI000621453A|nr:hypothetical protein [Neorhizobium galegae]KAB1126301.1 hypothetical protein F4V90_04080 [Neorhizobium galegae]MCQ1805272.1 hypothetical protein [Neorhizobium galegae]CDZ56034.1 Hypothetical protein NGAL_HAMBI2566_05840 [Neorhizobium galegae bv. orientalis]
MSVADAVSDRIQKRREKLERAGVFKPQIESMERTALHLWQVNEQGRVVRVPDTNPGIPGVTVVVLPTGKFISDGPMPPPITFEMWFDGHAHLGVVPEMPPNIPHLIDAPEPPEYAPLEIQTAPDAVLVTGERKPLADLSAINKDAVLVDLNKRRQKRDEAQAKMHPEAQDMPMQLDSEPKHKPRTREERIAALKAEMEATLRQQLLAERETARPAMSFAMPSQYNPV